MIMPSYTGKRTDTGLTVTVDGQPLDPRFDLRNHSPTGFECGYGGSGPAQLALAILAHHLGNDAKAQCWYQNFKWMVIAHLPRNKDWILTADDVERALAEIEALRSHLDANLR